MTRLIYKADDGSEQFVELSRANPSIAVGRASKCAIHTKEPTVSRIHAIITWQQNGSVLVQDPPNVHPVNGTAADGVRLKANATLDAYNEIRCGLFVIQVEPEDEPEEERENFYDSLFEQPPVAAAIPDSPSGASTLTAATQHSSSSQNQHVVRHSSVSAQIRKAESVEIPLRHSSVSVQFQQYQGADSVDQPLHHSSGSMPIAPTVTMPPASSQAMPPAMPSQAMPPAMPSQAMPPAMPSQAMLPAMPSQAMPPAMPSQAMPPAMPSQAMQPAMPSQAMQPAASPAAEPVIEDDSVTLYYLGPDGKEKTVTLSQYSPVITIGSNSHCTVSVPSKHVCAHHATITWNSGRLFVKNVMSDNIETETRIDGMHMDRGAELEFCSDLQCGDFFLFFDPISSDYRQSIEPVEGIQEQSIEEQEAPAPEQNYAQQNVQNDAQYAQTCPEQNSAQQNAQNNEQSLQSYQEEDASSLLSEEELAYYENADNVPDAGEFEDEDESTPGYKTTMVDSSYLPPNPYDDDDDEDSISIAKPQKSEDNIIISEPEKSDDMIIISAQPEPEDSIEISEQPDPEDSIIIISKMPTTSSPKKVAAEISEQPKTPVRPMQSVQLNQSHKPQDETTTREYNVSSIQEYVKTMENQRKQDDNSSESQTPSVTMSASGHRRRPVVHLAKEPKNP